MAQSTAHAERISELDDRLRTENMSEAFLTPTDDGFYGWYSRALSSLAVLTVGEQLQYAPRESTTPESHRSWSSPTIGLSFSMSRMSPRIASDQ